MWIGGWGGHNDEVVLHKNWEWDDEVGEFKKVFKERDWFALIKKWKHWKDHEVYGKLFIKWILWWWGRKCKNILENYFFGRWCQFSLWQ